MKSPAFQWYPKDYMSDGNVLRMDFNERGIYSWLLSSCWLEDGIPEDVGELARICGLGSSKMRRVWARIAPCFIEHPRKTGWLTNGRLEKERERQAEWSAKSAAGGRKSAAKRATVVQPPLEPPHQPNLNTAVRSSQFASETQLQPLPHVAVEKSGVDTRPAYTKGELLESARAVCGLNKWPADDLRKANSVLVSWYGEGKKPETIHAAIHGARLLVDAGKVDWLKPRQSFGLHALRNRFILAEQGDGRAQRPFFDVAVEAFQDSEDPVRQRAASAIERISASMPRLRESASA